MYEQTIRSAFAAIKAGLSFIEPAERRRVLRSLRIIYFYPDGILKELRSLIAEDGDYEEIIQRGVLHYPDSEEAAVELDFLTSNSVATNLRLTLPIVESLRRIADQKHGIRSILHAIFFTWMFNQDKERVKQFALEADSNISLLNQEIIRIEEEIAALEHAERGWRGPVEPA